MCTLKSDGIRDSIQRLSDNVRAENIDYENYIEMYSGLENIKNISNKSNTVIYGRRGSGKTHLLRALQEEMIDKFIQSRNFPIYLDLRRIIPLLSQENSSADITAILIFKYLIQEMSHTLAANIKQIYEYNEFDRSLDSVSLIKERGLDDYFNKIYLEFDGRKIRKPKDLTVSEEEVRSLKGNLEVSSGPKLKVEGEGSTKTVKEIVQSSYISILDVTNSIEDLMCSLRLSRITILIDEWSEIDSETQLILAEIIKKSFSAIKVTVKIAAIPNRTNLGIKTPSKFIGLEDGGDIFGYNLDMRYVFEVNKVQTRDFFNDLLYKHLSSINKDAIDELLRAQKVKKEKLINIFFANVALNEILVACAGIPRDFINLFIHSYDRYLLSSGSSATRISVSHLRAANSEWYDTDKKEQVDKHSVERKLLTGIVEEVIEKRKSMHFLVPEKYSNNPYIQNLIDFRVMHLRRSRYSHKDHAGVSYNVYSIDYGCYNSLNIAKHKLDSTTLDSLNVKDFRDIRRISLEDSFFQHFLMEIGEAFTCPHCNKPVDTNHLAYIKQGICNNCYEKIDDKVASA